MHLSQGSNATRRGAPGSLDHSQVSGMFLPGWTVQKQPMISRVIQWHNLVSDCNAGDLKHM